MNSKVCMITGANAGIGRATALGLAKLGATVVMVCRNRDLGQAAAAEIRAASGNQAIDLLLADLSSQAAIRQLAADFKTRYSQLHVLINNAGIAPVRRSITVDGVESVLAVNYLAPFLLTNLLLDVLKASAPARVGIPVVVLALIMIPLQLFVFAPPEGQSPSAWPVDVGHLWFLEHLLIFSVCYALGRTIWKGRAESTGHQANPPGYLAILIFALALAVVSAVVRIWSPIDKWVYPLGFIRVAFADVPRDLSFFIIGIVAYRHQWLLRFPTRAGMVWLLLGVILAGLWYLYALELRRVLPISGTAMGVIYPIWESLLCCGMCIGLTVLFRERLNFQGRLGKAMAQSQYAAYIFHVLVVMLFQFLLLSFALPPLAKFALATLTSVPATFLFSAWVRKPLRL